MCAYFLKERKGARTGILNTLNLFHSMTQNYSNRGKSTRRKSLNQFISSGRYKTIKNRIVEFLSIHCPDSYTSRELQYYLDILIPSSICGPLNELKNDETIEVSASKFDELTNREVSAYSLSNCGKS